MAFALYNEITTVCIYYPSIQNENSQFQSGFQLSLYNRQPPSSPSDFCFIMKKLLYKRFYTKTSNSTTFDVWNAPHTVLLCHQKFRAEDKAIHFFTDALGIANRNSWLDDHNCIRVILHDQLNNSLDSKCVEKVLFTVVVRLGVQSQQSQHCCMPVLHPALPSNPNSFLLSIFNILIPNRRFSIVHQFFFSGDSINYMHFVMLCQQSRTGQFHIPCFGNCNNTNSFSPNSPSILFELFPVLRKDKP